MKVFLTTNSGGQYKVVCLIPVPIGDNAAGTPWQSVLLDVGVSGSTTIEKLLTAEELQAITDGELVEHPCVIAGDNSSSPMNAGNIERIGSEVADFIRRLKNQYNHYGHSEEI